MPLTLSARQVGRVIVIGCGGRIVAGADIEALRACVLERLPNQKEFVLNLRDVTFVDSSGLGTMVRLLATGRRMGGNVRLCNVPPEIEKILRLTNLTRLFQLYESEETAIADYYPPHAGQATPSMGVRLLCVDGSADVLAYVRELLTHIGYEVLSATIVPDALILLRASSPALLILGPNLKAAPGTRQRFLQEAATVPVIELGDEFSTLHAGEAATELLQKIKAQLGPAKQASTSM
ncbi:MAG: anti-sigma factor antagonist [Terriglobales bacterium]